VQSRFDEAVRLAEEAFTAELAKLVSHLTERLSGTDDGRQKVFRDSAVENLTEFFQRFHDLNVRSSEQLDQLVSQAQQGRWLADMSPVGGPVLTDFAHRSEALAAEHSWLGQNWLGSRCV
jgi:hypothetical protein